MNEDPTYLSGGATGSVGHIVNAHGIPEVCPSCGAQPVSVRVTDYDMIWHDGRVVCATCGHFFRLYDAG